jgi:hypothetical protein
MQIGIYRSIFPADNGEQDYIKTLKDMQQPVIGGRTWAVFMVAGGHFAGAVIRVSNSVEEEEDTASKVQKKKLKQPKPDTEILKHKTFHRYTSEFFFLCAVLT